MSMGAFLAGNTAVRFGKAKLKLDAQQRRCGVLEFTLAAEQVSQTLPPMLNLAHGAMQRNRGLIRADTDLSVEGMAVELRLYPEQVKPELILPGATLKKFKFKRDPKDNDGRVLLSFQTEALLDKESGAFVVNQFGNQVWILAVEEQLPLPLPVAEHGEKKRAHKVPGG